jgi:hypothetical protein
MSRSRYLILITSMQRSPAMHRLALILPLVMAATTAEAPLVQSSTITVSSDAPTPKKPETPPIWYTNPRSIPPEISLLHSTPDDWSTESPVAERDPLDVKAPLLWPEFQPPATPDPTIAIANDPPTAQPLPQTDPVGVDDSGLLSRDFSDPDTGTSNSGSGFSVDDPTASADGGNPASPSAGTPTPVPEPSSIMLLPAVAILMRRRRR